jgi:hypothetical protein
VGRLSRVLQTTLGIAATAGAYLTVGPVAAGLLVAAAFVIAGSPPS